MIPSTSTRVPESTSDAVNRQIRQEMEARVAQYQYATAEEFSRRLEELDREWDVERMLEANASSLAFTGCVLSATVNRKWILLPLAVTGFLLLHAVQGWCPPLPVLRRLGFRTQREIDEGRFALKMLRGDFQSVKGGSSAFTPTREILDSVAQ